MEKICVILIIKFGYLYTDKNSQTRDQNIEAEPDKQFGYLGVGEQFQPEFYHQNKLTEVKEVYFENINITSFILDLNILSFVQLPALASVRFWEGNRLKKF